MASSPSILQRRIRADGLDLHVAVAGNGPPVILLHGFPESWRSWQHQIAPLAAAGFSVWAPNLRGYPPSDFPPHREAYHLRHLVEDVACLVEATGYGRAHIAGHDWGGIIAWTFAGMYPQRLDRLVILNAPHMKLYTDRVWRSSQLLRSLYVLFFQLPGLPERLLASRHYKLVRDIFREMPARKQAFTQQDIEACVNMLAQRGALTAALDYYRINMRSDGLALARAARTDAPTLVIWGSAIRRWSSACWMDWSSSHPT
ncbi:alpha/beta hydrolase [Oxalobacteraceae bacterium R-40]|uniref:Alpha/beta hydrolase n=1 Tax=Keguizhuia sedimenti TaxID=3064264 RepID=A0ABU1BSA3_9BURK|nr:alpha/beta hydrolase [Oxalobacteraceae bacterium R-40]